MIQAATRPNGADRLVFHPGDLVFFAGRDRISRAIALKTATPWQLIVQRRWISHVGIVAPHNGRGLLFESTSQAEIPCHIQRRRVCGVQAHDIGLRLQTYRGRAWVAHIRRPLTGFEQAELSTWLRQQLGTGYDFTQAGRSGLQFLARWLGLPNPENDSLFYCSELVYRGLEQLRRVRQSNASNWTPAAEARAFVSWGVYHDLEEISC